MSGKRYTEEFKIEAVKQLTEVGYRVGEVAQRLGAKSRNTYARYERGTSAPTLEKLNDLLQAVSPDRDFVLHQSLVA